MSAAATDPGSLHAAILAALRASPIAMRALDLSRALAALPEPIRADNSAVNKALYAAPDAFEKVDGPGAPAWRARARLSTFAAQTTGLIPFSVGRLGVFFLDPATPDAGLRAFLLTLVGLVPAGAAPTLLHHPTPGGRRVGALAAEAGFGVGEKE